MIPATPLLWPPPRSGRCGCSGTTPRVRWSASSFPHLSTDIRIPAVGGHPVSRTVPGG